MSALPPKADINSAVQNVCFVPKADIGGIGRGFDFLGYQHSPQGLASKAAGEVRLNHNQIDPSSLSRRALAHGYAFLGGSWDESIVNNT